jgi:crotonobetainyl-CoA:carnitine CoA-transferase CaiB-like acyl-CoA transferase
MTIKKAPLAGLRVLDFGHFIAGPLAGVFLADQGSEVNQVRKGNA